MAATRATLGTDERRDFAKATGEMDHRIKRVIVEMEKHLDSELSLDLLAQSVNLSTSRFRHLFKAETGTTPAQYLKSLRMSRAKKLVETTLLNIKQIRCSIGVHDKGHFARDFEKSYGLPPTQYRARIRGARRGSN